MPKRFYSLNLRDLGKDGTIDRYTLHHKKYFPKSELALHENYAGTEAIMVVANTDDATELHLPITGATQLSHRAAIAKMRDPSWWPYDETADYPYKPMPRRRG